MTNETIATETTEAVGEFPIDELLSDGITNTPPSFVRAILKAASDPEVTSFAGGLPNCAPGSPIAITIASAPTTPKRTCL